MVQKSVEYTRDVNPFWIQGKQIRSEQTEHYRPNFCRNSTQLCVSPESFIPTDVNNDPLNILTIPVSPPLIATIKLQCFFL